VREDESLVVVVVAAVRARSKGTSRGGRKQWNARAGIAFSQSYSVARSTRNDRGENFILALDLGHSDGGLCFPYD